MDQCKVICCGCTGPAIIGLPTSELLNIVTVHVDIIEGKMHDDKKKVLKTMTCEDLKRAYPNQFDNKGTSRGLPNSS